MGVKRKNEVIKIPRVTGDVRSPLAVQSQILNCYISALLYEVHNCIKTKTLGFLASSHDPHMLVFCRLNL